MAAVLAVAPLPACLLRHGGGIPCPGCGMTRALLALARLDVATATRLHPLVVPIAVLALVPVIGASGATDGALLAGGLLRLGALFGGVPT